ncbi:MAG: sigma-70 family RNA polymerase sigma factor [Chloroflexi bacterium]|nr:sigma-70 family RNA polymerase sigma factor [Chloroflexota bacterium]
MSQRRPIDVRDARRPARPPAQPAESEAADEPEGRGDTLREVSGSLAGDSLAMGGLAGDSLAMGGLAGDALAGGSLAGGSLAGDSLTIDGVAADDLAADDLAAEDAQITATANDLARAYQAGRTEALAELFDLLRPLLQYPLGRYGHGRRGLPSALDMDDLQQQSWLILDGLARRWDPAVGDFPAYIRRAFAWELWRYVRSLSPSRRARAVRVDNVQHDDLLERLGEQAGADGRAWDDDLIVTELLAELDPVARWTLLLHILEDRALDDVARALELTQATAYQTYRRALDWLRLRADLDMDPDDALAREPTGRPAIERLVEALHAGAGPGRRLPGRASVCAAAKLSEVRFARLMGLLIELGCVEGRSARKPGRLIHTTPAETLTHLRHATARIAAEV